MYVKKRETHITAALNAYGKSRRLPPTEIPRPHTLVHFLADICHYAESVGSDAAKLIDQARSLYMSERDK